MSAYQIADEPAPSPLARFAVNPLFPLLAVMLGGVWAAWPWFAFNAIAVGSPTRRAELAWLAGGFAALLVLVFFIAAAVGAGWIDESMVPYTLVGITVAKLAIVYAVYVLQARTIELYEYYGGVLKNGLWVLLACLFVGDRALESLPPILRVVLE